MPVQIIINGADANESISELTTLAAAIRGQATAAQPVTAAVPQQQKAETAKQPRTAKAEPEKSEPESTDKPEPDNQPEPASEPTSEPDGDQADIPTIPQLREVAVKKDKKAVKALLDKHACKSLSDVPEAKRATFMKELEAL